jgi:uncharacterized protein YutE (UPF0331/DUF86 family)
LVDRTLILRKLSQLEEYLKQVEEFSSITLSEYSADWKTQRIVERTLQMMVEISIDIAGHIVSDKRFRIPTSYADAFRVLMENNCITATLCQSLERMAKFRNVVVHHYDRVDEAIVVAILKKHLSDFLLFRDAILSTLTEVQQ